MCKNQGVITKLDRHRAGLAEDLRRFDYRIVMVTGSGEHHAQSDPVAKLLMTLRGAGMLTASASVRWMVQVGERLMLLIVSLKLASK